MKTKYLFRHISFLNENTPLHYCATLLFVNGIRLQREWIKAVLSKDLRGHFLLLIQNISQCQTFGQKTALRRCFETKSAEFYWCTEVMSDYAFSSSWFIQGGYMPEGLESLLPIQPALKIMIIICYEIYVTKCNIKKLLGLFWKDPSHKNVFLLLSKNVDKFRSVDATD